MKRIIGICLMAIPVFILFMMTALTSGLKEAAIAWGFALLLSGSILGGIVLIVGDD